MVLKFVSCFDVLTSSIVFLVQPISLVSFLNIEGKFTVMDCNRSCQDFCRWIETVPCHVKYSMPKERFPALPECFKETVLGEYVDGAGRQFRGPNGAHVHEFEDKWVLHRDIVDADSDPFGHLVNDAPEYLVSVLLGAAVGLATGKRGKDKALIAAGLAGAFALMSGKVLKMLNGDPSDGDETVPKLG